MLHGSEGRLSVLKRHPHRLANKSNQRNGSDFCKLLYEIGSYMFIVNTIFIVFMLIDSLDDNCCVWRAQVPNNFVENSNTSIGADCSILYIKYSDYRSMIRL